MQKSNKTPTPQKTKYLQVQVPLELGEEFERITIRLGLSKQRSLAIALHVFVAMSEEARLKAYGETLDLFTNAEGPGE